MLPAWINTRAAGRADSVRSVGSCRRPDGMLDAAPLQQLEALYSAAFDELCRSAWRADAELHVAADLTS